MAEAWSKSCLSLGRINDVRLWRVIRKLNLVVEMERKTASLDRISSFVHAVDFGINLHKLDIVLKFGEDEAWPKHMEDVVKLLSYLNVRGPVSVCFDEDFKDSESEQVVRTLLESIAK